MMVRFHKSHLFNLPGCHSQVIGRSLTSVTVQSEPRSVIVEEMPPRMPPDLPTFAWMFLGQEMARGFCTGLEG